MRLVDVGAALSARELGEGGIVLDLHDEFCPWNQGRWRVGEGAVAHHRRGRPALGVSELGSVYLGGFTFDQLLRAGPGRGAEAGRRREGRQAVPDRPAAVVPRALLADRLDQSPRLPQSELARSGETLETGSRSSTRLSATGPNEKGVPPLPGWSRRAGSGS